MKWFHVRWSKGNERRKRYTLIHKESRNISPSSTYACMHRHERERERVSERDGGGERWGGGDAKMDGRTLHAGNNR